MTATTDAPSFDDTTVEAYLEATHAIGEHLLETFAQACRTLQIAFFLTSGTLLGAARNGAWIPWDDDVDVIMFREDYVRFAEGVVHVLPSDVAFSSAETRDDHITTIPRLVHLDSRRVHVGRMRERTPLETRHIALDIFVLDRAPRSRVLRRLWSLSARGLDKATSARYTTPHDVLAAPGIGAGRRLLELCGVVLARVLPLAAWHALRTWLVTRPAAWGSRGPLVATNYSTPAGRKMTFEDRWYLPASEIRFEGRSYPAPGDTTAVLTELYGVDHLTPPAVEDRRPVHIRGGLTASLGDRDWMIEPQVPEASDEAPLDEDHAHLGSSSFRRQVLWSLAARGVAAGLQILVLVLMARGLSPSSFAFVATVNVVLQVVVAVNGFGLLRQIEFRRSRDAQDPSLPSLFALRLRFSYASAALWLMACIVGWLVTGNDNLLCLLPAALWLLVEQTTQVWNGVSVVDGRSRNLLASYATRRAPVVAFLAVALALDLHIVWAWTLGLAAGSILSYAQGYRGQERWARMLWPRRSAITEKLPLDLGYWLGLVGMQLRDMDVAAVSAISSHAAGLYAFPARLVAPMNLVTFATASNTFPRVARHGMTRRQLRRNAMLGILPVLTVAGTVALLSPLLPVLLGGEYAHSVNVLRVACVTAVLSGMATMLGVVVQALSTEDAQAVGRMSLGFALAQIGAAAVGAVVGGAVFAAVGVAVVNAVLAATIWAYANRRLES